MGKDEVQKRLDTGMGGVPLLKPEEQHKYLGTFRERCCLAMTIQQMKSRHNQQALLAEFKKHSNVALLLNGAISEELQEEYIRLATENNMRFTIINDHVKNDPDSFGAILAGKEALNEAVIDVEEKYPVPAETPEKEEKEGFWGKLFH